MGRHPVLRACTALLAAGCVAVATLPPAVADEVQRLREQRDRLQDRSSRTESTLDGVRSDLHDVSLKADDAEERLRAVEEQLAAAEARLAELEAELEDASAAHEAAVAEVERLQRELILAVRQVERTASRLQEKEGIFGARAAATYKYGGVTYAEVLVDQHEFEDFLASLHFLRSALDQDKRIVDDVAELLHELDRQRAHVGTLEAQAREHEEVVTATLERVRGLTEAQRHATTEVQRERAERGELLRELRQRRSAYEAKAQELERESNQIAAELSSTQARFEAAKRRAEAEARQRAEAEAQRRAEAARQQSAPSSGSSSSGSSAGGSASSRGYVWPTSGRLTSGYGYRTHPIYGTRRLHAGIDIAAPTGRAIVAAKEGLVVSAGWRGGYGNAVVIDHGGGYATLYGHMSSISVSAGRWVSRGQHIGGVGSTGQSTGPHLHFEVRVNGAPRDPMPYLP